MSADEYTPTTDKVREDYVFDYHDRWDLEREHAFDRWLAEIRAAARDADPIPGAVTIAENEMVRQDRARWLAAHEAEIRAERVAHDRETLARASWDWSWRFDDSGIKDRRWDDPDYAAMRALHEAFADFLLASSVFKVRSRTAPDRETLARALCEIDMRGKDRSIEEVLTPGIALWVRYLPEADALLASGVLGVSPADAPGTAITLHAYTSADLDAIRAEAVENAAHLVIGTPGFNALRARAAEYRKAASS